MEEKKAKMLKEMTRDELLALITSARTELAERLEEKKVLIILRDEFDRVAEYKLERYNGGWTKRVTGLDKSKTNGYSLLGEFVKGATKKNYYATPAIFVDCDVAGSRKYQKKRYQLFYLDNNGKMELLQTDTTADYAVNFWDKIEEKL